MTLLEALPIGSPISRNSLMASRVSWIGSVIVNRNIPSYLAPEDLAKAAEGVIDADAVRAGLTKAGIT
ncbi:ATPase, partial [Mycobacterium sp. ITM-2017-0098]